MTSNLQHYLALIGAGLLAVSSSIGTAGAQTDVPVNADGAFVVANDDGAPIASGAGDDIFYGDVLTGGNTGETLGDASAVYSPNVPDSPGPGGGVPVIPGAGDGLIGGVPMRPPAPDPTTLTTTSLASVDGTATENVPVQALAPTDAAPVATDTAADSAPAPTDTAAAPVASDTVATDTVAADGGFCSQYATWYDAQIAYENLGSTAADPALVQEVDPNYDGIACEGLMV